MARVSNNEHILETDVLAVVCKEGDLRVLLIASGVSDGTDSMLFDTKPKRNAFFAAVLAALDPTAWVLTGGEHAVKKAQVAWACKDGATALIVCHVCHGAPVTFVFDSPAKRNAFFDALKT